jgi:hypothetical protein
MNHGFPLVPVLEGYHQLVVVAGQRTPVPAGVSGFGRSLTGGGGGSDTPCRLGLSWACAISRQLVISISANAIAKANFILIMKI